jgi:ferrous iron transport protein A
MNTPAPPPGRQEPALPLQPLSTIGNGRLVELVSVAAGRGLQQRLAEMRLGPGARFRVETCGRPGPFVIVVGRTRLVLGQGMVQRMFVRAVAGPGGEGGAS